MCCPYLTNFMRLAEMRFEKVIFSEFQGYTVGK